MSDFSIPSLGSVANQSLATNQAQRADRAGASDDPEAAAVEFEKLLATILVKELRSSLKGGFFPEGPGNDTYNAWFDEAIGESLGNSRSLGIVGQLKAQLNTQATEEVSPVPTSLDKGGLVAPPGAGNDEVNS